MSIGMGIAVAGIWIGVGMAAHGMKSDGVIGVAMCAAFATALVSMAGQ